MKFALIALITICHALIALAADPDMTPEQINENLEYAAKLQELGFHDFAEEVYKMLPHNPEIKPLVLAKFQIFMRQHRNDEKKMEHYIQINSGDDPEMYWLMKIRLADAYWSWGEPEKCLKIYKEFMDFYKTWAKQEQQ